MTKIELYKEFIEHLEGKGMYRLDGVGKNSRKEELKTQLLALTAQTR